MAEPQLRSVTARCAYPGYLAACPDRQPALAVAEHMYVLCDQTARCCSLRDTRPGWLTRYPLLAKRTAELGPNSEDKAAARCRARTGVMVQSISLPVTHTSPLQLLVGAGSAADCAHYASPDQQTQTCRPGTCGSHLSHSCSPYIWRGKLPGTKSGAGLACITG